MKYISAFICVCLVAIVSAESGYFIPKAYYTIDSNGARSELSLISPNIQRRIFHRLKRAAQVVSSSSSSSSSSSNGGPTVFHQTSSNYVGGQPAYAGSQPAYTGNLNSRFGEEDSYGYQPVGAGHVTHTSGVIQNGQVYSNTYHANIRK